MHLISDLTFLTFVLNWLNLYFFSLIVHSLPPPSTLDMLIPANAVGKVLGKGGANIANIRKVSSHILNCLFFYVIAGGTNI